MDEGAPLAHVIGDHEEDRGDRGHGDQCGIGHEDHQHQNENNGVYDPGNGRAAAVFDIGGGAGYGAGRGDPAEECGTDIAAALGDQFHIGTVMRVDHAVCNHAGEQGFDSGQDCDGETVRRGVSDRLQAELRHMEGRKLIAYLKLVSYSVYGQVCEFNNEDPGDNGDERAGDLVADLRPDDQDRKAYGADQQRPGVERRDIGGDGPDLVHAFDGYGTGRVAESEEVLDLADQDGQCDAGSETGRDSVRNEFDQPAETEQTHQDQYRSGNDGGQHQAIHTAFGNDPCHYGRKCRRRPGDLDAASAQERNDKACNDGRIKALFRTYAGGKRQSDGERQCNDGYDDAADRIGGELLAAVMLHGAEEHRFDLILAKLYIFLLILIDCICFAFMHNFSLGFL